VTLPAFVAERRRASTTALAARLQLSIDISCLQVAQQQTLWPPLLLSIDGTDRRTPGYCVHPALHTMQALRWAASETQITQKVTRGSAVAEGSHDAQHVG